MMALFLVFTVFVWPLVLLAACLSAGVRKVMPRLLGLAPIPALVLAWFGVGGEPMEIGWMPYGMVVRIDASAAMLLAASSLLWMVAGFAVPSFFRGKSIGGSFTVCWLLTLIGTLGVFLVTDLMSFLIFYALVSLPAYGLITCAGAPEARRAGKIYMGFALLGESVLLLAFVLLASGARPSSGAVLTLLLVGFGMKMALLPLHFWMPLSYTAAPIPVAAVLSGAAVKAGVIGMLRFLPFGTAMPTLGETLTVVGFCGAFFGVAAGLTQTNPKTVLAYSSVSQMGFLAAVMGLGLSAGDVGVVPLAAFYAAHHVLVKGGLFLAVGAAGSRWLVLAPGALIGLGLAGLPLTGGALAKLAVKEPLGYGIVATLASLSAVGTAWLMVHFLFRLAETRKEEKSAGPLFPWLVAAALCLVFPWMAFPLAGLSLPGILAPAALWKTLWPVAVGVIFAFVFLPFSQRLPRIPAGDIVALGGCVSRAAVMVASVFQRADGVLRRWPVAACAVVLSAVLWAVAQWLGRN